MKVKSKIISVFLAVVLSLGVVIVPTGFAETAITASAASYDGKVESITKKVNGTEVTLYWDKVSSATSYRLYMKNSEGKYKRYSDCKLKKTSDGRIKCTISGLEKNKEYTFAVAPVKKTDEGDTLVGNKKAVKFKTGSSSSNKLTSIPNPAKICSYLSYSDVSSDGLKVYSGMATYDNYENYENYLENHGLYLDIVSSDCDFEDDGMLFTFIYEVYTDSKMTKSLGTIGISHYFLYDDDADVLVVVSLFD